MEANNIVDSVRAGGVVGAGGAGFPTHVKLNCKVDMLVINAAECEPLIMVDQQLIESKTRDILSGVELVLKAVGARGAIMGIKSKHKKAVKALKSSLADFSNITIHELGDFYPAGDEQVLVFETTGRIVPEGGIPLAVGVVVINVETILNIYNSILGIPVTEKYVTVTGEVKNPMTVKVPIGSKVIDLIKLAGGTSLKDYMLLDGGPMMGKIIGSDSVVTKVTKGIIVLPPDHKIIISKTLNISHAIKRSMSACCQCRICTDMCPRFLLGHGIWPHMIMRAVAYGITSDSCAITSAMLCSECGVCDMFACPMGLPPRQINMAIKKQLAAGGYKNTHKNKPKEVSEFRDYRKIPVKKLIDRLDIKKWDKPAPLTKADYDPDGVDIRLSQHIGRPSVPIVAPGESVEKGQLIAKIQEGSLGCNMHASIKGKVKSVDKNSIVITRR